MQKMSFYEQIGIVIPGSVLVFGLVLYYPVMQSLTAKDGFSVGELGLFVLIAYAAGHLVAAIANALEGLFGGFSAACRPIGSRATRRYCFPHSKWKICDRSSPRV
jgi:hypothetical protein